MYINTQKRLPTILVEMYNRLANVVSIFPVKRLLCYHGNNKTVKKRKINHVILWKKGI